MAQDAVVCQLGVRDLGDQLRSDPVYSTGDRGGDAAHVQRRRRARVERALQLRSAVVAEAGSHASPVEERSVGAFGQHQRCKRASARRRAPPDDDEVAAPRALDLEPAVAAHTAVRRVAPLGDHPLVPGATDRVEHLRTATLDVLGELHCVVPSASRKEGGEARLALGEGKRGKVGAVLLEQVEGEVDERPAIGERGAKRGEVGPSRRVYRAHLPVEQGRAGGEGRERSD